MKMTKQEFQDRARKLATELKTSVPMFEGIGIKMKRKGEEFSNMDQTISDHYQEMSLLSEELAESCKYTLEYLQTKTEGLGKTPQIIEDILLMLEKPERLQK
jgi:hypothetical protein